MKIYAISVKNVLNPDLFENYTNNAISSKIILSLDENDPKYDQISTVKCS